MKLADIVQELPLPPAMRERKLLENVHFWGGLLASSLGDAQGRGKSDERIRGDLAPQMVFYTHIAGQG